MDEPKTRTDEYAPLELVCNFIQGSLPDIKVVPMQLPVLLDESKQNMYVAKSAIVGKITDDEQKIANKCLEIIKEELGKNEHKSVGIYGVFKNEMFVKEEHDDWKPNPTVTLRFAFPEKVDDVNKVEEPYEPQYTKHIRPFNYDQEELLKRIKENKDE